MPDTWQCSKFKWLMFSMALWCVTNDCVWSHSANDANTPTNFESREMISIEDCVWRTMKVYIGFWRVSNKSLLRSHSAKTRSIICSILDADWKQSYAMRLGWLFYYLTDGELNWRWVAVACRKDVEQSVWHADGKRMAYRWTMRCRVSTHFFLK